MPQLGSWAVVTGEGSGEKQKGVLRKECVEGVRDVAEGARGAPAVQACVSSHACVSRCVCISLRSCATCVFACLCKLVRADHLEVCELRGHGLALNQPAVPSCMGASISRASRT